MKSDAAEMDAVDVYYIPKRLPEGHGLGYIVASPDQISFHCFPEEVLGDHMAQQQAIARGTAYSSPHIAGICLTRWAA